MNIKNIKKSAIYTITAVSLLLSSGSVMPNEEILAFAAENDTVAVEVTNIKDFKDYNNDAGYGKLNGHWAENDIQVLVEKGGIKGIPNGDGTLSFEANNTVTTVQFFAMLLQAAGIDYSENVYGPDIEGRFGWAERVLERSRGALAGTDSDDGFIGLDVSDPYGNYWYATKHQPITRERVAYVVDNFIKNTLGNSKDFQNLRNLENIDETIIKDIDSVGNGLFDINTPGVSEIGKIKEDKQISKESIQGDIKRLYFLGILGGDNNGNFNPQGLLTRAEATAIVNRIFRNTERLDTSAIQAAGVWQGLTEEEQAEQKRKAEEGHRNQQALKHYLETGELVDGMISTTELR